MAFGHFLLGSHNLMVTALGLCMKWPLVPHVMLFVSQILFLPHIIIFSPSLNTSLLTLQG